MGGFDIAIEPHEIVKNLDATGVEAGVYNPARVKFRRESLFAS
jgi:hypothetical protein